MIPHLVVVGGLWRILGASDHQNKLYCFNDLAKLFNSEYSLTGNSVLKGRNIQTAVKKCKPRGVGGDDWLIPWDKSVAPKPVRCKGNIGPIHVTTGVVGGSGRSKGGNRVMVLGFFKSGSIANVQDMIASVKGDTPSPTLNIGQREKTAMASALAGKPTNGSSNTDGNWENTALNGQSSSTEGAAAAAQSSSTEGEAAVVAVAAVVAAAAAAPASISPVPLAPQSNQRQGQRNDEESSKTRRSKRKRDEEADDPVVQIIIPNVGKYELQLSKVDSNFISHITSEGKLVQAFSAPSSSSRLSVVNGPLMVSSVTTDLDTDTEAMAEASHDTESSTRGYTRGVEMQPIGNSSKSWPVPSGYKLVYKPHLHNMEAQLKAYREFMKKTFTKAKASVSDQFKASVVVCSLHIPNIGFEGMQKFLGTLWPAFFREMEHHGVKIDKDVSLVPKASPGKTALADWVYVVTAEQLTKLVQFIHDRKITCAHLATDGGK